jgi:predicted nucleic acid-binding protein
VSSRPSYLLDTNVLSETRKKKPDDRVISFLRAADSSLLYLSVLSLGELRKGIAMKERSDPDSTAKLRHWVDGLEYSFAERILGIDTATARLWGELSAQRSRPVIDTLLAATAITRDLIFVTRNTGDVGDIKMRMLDPWKS